LLGALERGRQGRPLGLHPLKLKGLGAPITIAFDGFLVPYIFASSEADAFFAVGFLHRYYRLWQMDVQRRLAEGKLAEVLAREAVPSDAYMRLIGLHRSAEAATARLRQNAPEAFQALESYAAGVNAAMGQL